MTAAQSLATFYVLLGSYMICREERMGVYYETYTAR